MRQIAERGTLFEEEVQEVASLSEHCKVLLTSATHRTCLRWHRWDIQSREPVLEHLPEVEEVLEAAIALDVSERITACNRVHVILAHGALLEDWFSDLDLHFAVVSRDVDRLIGILLWLHHAVGGEGSLLIWSSRLWLVAMFNEFNQIDGQFPLTSCWIDHSSSAGLGRRQAFAFVVG